MAVAFSPQFLRSKSLDKVGMGSHSSAVRRAISHLASWPELKSSRNLFASGAPVIMFVTVRKFKFSMNALTFYASIETSRVGLVPFSKLDKNKNLFVPFEPCVTEL